MYLKTTHINKVVESCDIILDFVLASVVLGMALH